MYQTSSPIDIICPWCGEFNGCSLEWVNEEPDEAVCYWCKNPMIVWRETIVTYRQVSSSLSFEAKRAGGEDGHE